MNRRDFLIKTGAAAIGVLAASAIPFVAGAKDGRSSAGKGAGTLDLLERDVILFTGDSITDGSRERKYQHLANHIRALGNGYVQITAGKLTYRFPEKQLKIHNTGINGDTIVKMMARLESDILKFKPTVVSILVGVNDFNVAFSETGKGDPRRYEREYREMLTAIRTALPGVRLVIGEPYALKGAREKIDAWYPEFDAYRAVARGMADEFGATFIPYQSVYEKAMEGAPERHFSTDGIHPYIGGIGLMCNAWLQSVKDF